MARLSLCIGLVLWIGSLAAGARAQDGSVDAGGSGDGAGQADAVDAGDVDGGTADEAPTTEGGRDAGRAEVAPPPPLRPPPVTFRGRVVAKGTRAPLAGATISVDGAAAGETDAEGFFQVGAPPGPHQLLVEAPGYLPLGWRLELAEPAAERVFRLEPRDEAPAYETTVVARPVQVPSIDVGAQEARGTAGSAGDPFRVLGSLPGVSQIAWPAALYVVRGANPGNTGFFLDGIRIPALFHLVLGPSVIHPYFIEGMDFLPGGYPANYGGYVSGIVAARTAAPPTDRVHLSADVTLYDAGGIVTAPINDRRGTVAVAARYSYTGALFSLLQSDDTLRFGDYQARVDHPLLGGRGTVFAFGSLDDLGWYRPGAPDQQQFAALQFHRLDLRWRRAVGGGRLLAGTTFGADWARSRLFDRPIAVRALSLAPRVSFTHPLGRAADLEVGADALAQDFDTEVPDFQRRQSDLGRDRAALSLGAFATVPIRFGQRLVVAPGVRASYFAEEGARVTAPEPRLNLFLRATDRIAFKAAGGRFAQMPSLPVGVPGFESFGLQSLGLQTGVGGSLGVELAIPGDSTASFTAYEHRLRLTDIRNIDLRGLDPTAPDYLVARDGVARGIEVMLRRPPIHRLHGWLAYTLSSSQRRDENGVLGRSDWDQRHVLNLVTTYRLGRRYTFGLRFHYHSGRRAPVIDSQGEYRDLPSYHQVDLRFSRRHVFDRFILDLYIDIGNATLRRDIVQLRQINPNPGSAPPIIQEDAFRIILPTIGVHAEL